MRARNYYVYRWLDEPEEFYVKSFHSTEIDRLLHEAARMIVFSDTTYEEVDEICVNGRKLYYAGWRPDMEIIFKDCETNEIVFDEFFPEWEH